MFKITMAMKKVDLNVKKFEEDLSEALANEIKEGTRAFLKAVLTKVPVYTGQARGSLKPVGQFLNMNISIRPTKGAVKKHPNVKPSDGEKFGSIEFIKNGLNVKVTITQHLMHYLINEFHDVSNSINLKRDVPWNSFEVGRLAYIEYMKTHLKKRIPIIANYITFTLIKET